MPETFANFKSKIKSAVHPGGLALPLDFQFGEDVVQALIDLQRWIPGYKSRNRDVHPFCSTYFACGATVIPKPRGKIKRVYSLQGGCCPVFLDFMPSYDEFANWLNFNRKSFINPPNEGMPPLPAPFKYAEAVTDKGKRFNFGFYTIKGDQIWLGHRIESSESVVVEWEGVRRSYTETTLMPYDDNGTTGNDSDGDSGDMGTELRSAVAAFVRAEDYRKNRRDLEGFTVERSVYENQRADLKHQDWNESMPEAIALHSEAELPYDQLVTTPCGYDQQCDPAEAEEQTIVFANTADYGSGGENMQAVAELINGWAPDWMTTNGDNWYDNDLSPANFEAYALKWYRNFIYPYLSFEDPKLTTEALVNRFFPAIGNHDRDPLGHLSTVLAMCHLPKVMRGGVLVPSTGYYSVRPLNGFVEHFFFDTGYVGTTNLQADGNDVNTIQGLWLEAALRASTARWKVVHMHHPGYTSDVNASGNAIFVGDGTNSYAAMRRIINKLKLWGADLVLCGHVHSYERLDVMGLPVIVNGSGGKSLDVLGAPVPFSRFIYDEGYGAGRATITCESLLWEFIGTDGTVIDTLELTKAG